jgi:hypothetical protein
VIKVSLCDDNSVEKLKKQPNFYAKGSQIRSVFFTNKPMVLLVYKEDYFNTNNLDFAILSLAVSLMQEFDDVFLTVQSIKATPRRQRSFKGK